MTLVNTLLGGLFAVLLRPLAGVHPLWGLALVSLLTAVGMLLVFRATSNQRKLESVKRQIHACLFEIRLFNDDLRSILRAQLEILRHNARYMALSLVPLLWMIVPFVLIVAQLHAYYGLRGPRPGDTTLVVARLASGPDGSPGRQARPAATLEPSAGLAVETPAVWSPALGEIAWRVRVLEEGPQEAVITLNGEDAVKKIAVARRTEARSSLRTAAGAWCSLTDPERLVVSSGLRGWAGLPCALLHPVERPLPAEGAFASIRVTLGPARIDVLGWRVHWLVVYIVLSLVFALLLRKRLGVVI